MLRRSCCRAHDRSVSEKAILYVTGSLESGNGWFHGFRG
jgi:hypothetical protein